MTDNKKIRNCAIYARVSTSEQKVDAQLKQLKAFAYSQNDEVVEIYIDKMSGAVTQRPEFQRMLRDARMRKFEIILVSSLDRFSREGIINTLTYLQRLKKYGVALKSIRESWCDTTDEGVGEMLISVVAWLSKQERINISKNTKRTLDQYKKDLEEKGYFINKKGKKCYSLGRPKGSRDLNPRNNLGYLKRWEK
jgi:site-specific DNA recombinase